MVTDTFMTVKLEYTLIVTLSFYIMLLSHIVKLGVAATKLHSNCEAQLLHALKSRSIDSWYIAVWYDTILHTAQQLRMQKLQFWSRFGLTKDIHTSP